ncbi:hypothetical protein N8K70_02995 [Microbacterium betulae]|uniref:Methylase-associated X1 domain-containing protein n=1 Tax=Microbacterium betulae TaxID=2981139 RepID=A0AA97FJW9_9MICO|nr:hypothetical protein [Microbacterium sp. AB]WOF23660.1 hypothetical protein N8K70_02995 [Microbacterium sp. AB]
MPTPVDSAADALLPLGRLAPVVQRSRVADGTKRANQLFAASLEDYSASLDSAETDQKPFDLQMSSPFPPLLRVYMFTMTTHPSERQEGAYRIQVMLPGKARHFDATDNPFIILAGFEPKLEVFAMWDAMAHDVATGIAHSKGVQLRENTLLTALSQGVACQQRTLRHAGETETVIASRPDALPEALELRWQLSIERLTA